MKIFNVRLGLATNSSSSHSIVLIRKPSFKNKFKDNLIDGGSFGWNFFTVASQEAKSLYLTALLYHDLEKMGGEEIAKTIVSSWLGVDLDSIRHVPDVDHQSFIEIPSDWEGKAPDKKFFDEFKAFILRDDVAILGGNDNEERQHNLLKYSSRVENKFLKECGGDHIVCRKDESNNYWVLFNKNNGTKVRLSFDTNATIPNKASLPELVDIKITDFCPFNCAYCYQASTLKGKHASTDSILNLANILAEMKVFEVALGGGEPTLHPDFIKILAHFKEVGIVPNFTTKSLQWLKDDTLRKQILDVAGNFAYSCEKKEDVIELANLLNKYEIQFGRYMNSRAVVHYVMGIGSETNFEEVVRAACDNGLEITLLGYKTNGRGALFKPKNSFDWMSIINKINEDKYIRLGIDTKLAQDSTEQLKSNGIPDWMYFTEEGKFSMYIDAVKGVIGPSSYCDDKEMSLLEFESFGDFNRNVEVVERHFQSY